MFLGEVLIVTGVIAAMMAAWSLGRVAAEMEHAARRGFSRSATALLPLTLFLFLVLLAALGTITAGTLWLVGGGV